MKSAFTLIEILIVVILLGILAAIVVPQFAETSDTAKANSRDTDIATLERQCALYKAKEGVAPGADMSDLVPDYATEIPTNPVTGSAYTYIPSTGKVN